MRIQLLLVAILWGTLTSSKLLDTSRHLLSRQERGLIWNGAAGLNWVELIVGLGLPFEVQRNAVTIGTVMKSFYVLPTNSSVYTDPSNVIFARKSRSTSRWVLYDLLEKFLALYNSGDGKSCVLKSICEASYSPLEESAGILAEILAAVLKPSSTNDILQHPTNMDYVSAEKLGSDKENCDLLYPECKLNILQQFSRFIK